MLLLLDNFDSFTYNLVQSFQMLNIQVDVHRSNSISIHRCLEVDPEYLVIGPGPGAPSDSGISKAAIEAFAGRIPILGICLGHQCLAELFGGRVLRAKAPMHGKQSQIYHDGKGIFSEIPQGFLATRYHSLTVNRDSLPSCLEVSAETSNGEIMGLRHKDYEIDGVQFHHESVLSEAGQQLHQNFIAQIYAHAHSS